MRGSVYKRCQCRDPEGHRVKGCRKNHGSWAFTIDAGKDPATGRRKQVARGRFRTRDEAEPNYAVSGGATWTTTEPG